MATAGYLGLVVAVALQWLGGRALTDPGVVDGALALLAVVLLAGAPVVAVRLAVRPTAGA